MYNTFSFNHGWGGMLNLMYEPTYKTYDRTYHAVYNIGGQIYKTMCKDKLQLTLTFNALGDRLSMTDMPMATKLHTITLHLYKISEFHSCGDYQEVRV